MRNELHSRRTQAGALYGEYGDDARNTKMVGSGKCQISVHHNMATHGK